jgi:hypothetical protein
VISPALNTRFLLPAHCTAKSYLSQTAAESAGPLGANRRYLMSVVTNLILSFSSLEQVETRMKDINCFPYNGGQLNLVSIDYNKDKEKSTVWYGGNKFFEGNIFIGAYNHFNTDEFVAYLKQINWEAPELVQLIVKEDWDEKFRIIELA